MQQSTIRHQIHCTGVGLHSGKRVYLTLSPAPADTGIIFYASGPHGKETIALTPEAVCTTALATTIRNSSIQIATVEHLLAALRGLGVDNARVTVEGGEVPIMDGSAADFAALIEEVGLRFWNAPKKVLAVLSPFSMEWEHASISVQPHTGFFVDYSIDFPHKLIGRQRFSLELSPDSFRAVAGARTFGFLHNVQAMREAGKALGGSLKNAVLLDETTVLNPEGLRYKDEFVRHKLLDFIGDMALAALPIYGYFTVSCSGHALNNRFLRQLIASGQLEERTVLRDMRIRQKTEVAQDPGRLAAAPA